MPLGIYTLLVEGQRVGYCYTVMRPEALRTRFFLLLETVFKDWNSDTSIPD